MSDLVLVVDADGIPLNPCKPGVARSLLSHGKASVFLKDPFTIILNKKVDPEPSTPTVNSKITLAV